MNLDQHKKTAIAFYRMAYEGKQKKQSSAMWEQNTLNIIPLWQMELQALWTTLSE